MDAKEYKEFIGKDRTKGLVPEWYHDIKSEQNHVNWNKINANLLKKGKKTRFKPGDSRFFYNRSLETLERLHKGTKNLKINK
jgi:hypothetical protein